MLKTWPHLDEVFCNLTQRDRPFFAFDYSSQIPVLKLSFLSATETVILLKTKQTKQKQQQQKNNIWQAIHKIQSKKSVNFFFI